MYIIRETHSTNDLFDYESREKYYVTPSYNDAVAWVKGKVIPDGFIEGEPDNSDIIREFVKEYDDYKYEYIQFYIIKAEQI